MARGIKGHTNNPNGRPKGVPNKTTKEIREAYQLLIESNLENMTKWIVRVASKDPEKAFKLMADLSEYVLPKLQRTEHAGDPNAPVEIKYDLSKLSTDTIKELIRAGLLGKST